MNYDFDYIVVGSGFGGSVSALRLTEKGYKVLVLEKGRWFKDEDFPKSNWNVKKWLWIPFLRFYGFFKITFFRHVGVLSGVGVGGGSLVYANTLPRPNDEFFSGGSWASLANWKEELLPFYSVAERMLGATENPKFHLGDFILRDIAKELNREEKFRATKVAVYFGDSEKTSPDPYFNGEGPERKGCKFCGACMIGCKHNAKNTLDKNYLYLAIKKGARVKSESEVFNIQPINSRDGKDGYWVEWKSSTKFLKKKGKASCRGVVFSGGVLGTLPLLFKLKKTTLPNISDMLGRNVLTNSESLMGVVAYGRDKIFSDGVAISSIFYTDEHSSVEPVRYPSGSGFWRLQVFPLVRGKNPFSRALKTFLKFFTNPVKTLKFYFVWDWAKHTQILLFMQTVNSKLKFEKGLFRMKSKVDEGNPPTALIPEAAELAERFAQKVDGMAGALLTDTLLGIPTTAHILGGCPMGSDSANGVIDKDNKIFGYQNLYICDGSMISSNPGVNPSLTITAITERAMSKIPAKQAKNN